jgi:hypothetical protein
VETHLGTLQVIEYVQPGKATQPAPAFVIAGLVGQYPAFLGVQAPTIGAS